MRIHPALAATAGAALLVLTLPTGTASAATGTFSYANPTPQTIVNPADGTCHALADEEFRATHLSNQTDKGAHLYNGADCTGGLIGVIQPYSTADPALEADGLRYF
ncbi:hypothetical protein [Allostreptomyces psammosilenae]|uniref:ABC-type transport system substrate-binding protein n=1 Tax=Allostreptomyces psammosilenae TaxID=1892865 RepID=A0A853AC82_9ACTN|nr:hypothetical protein [Allostreptomyces psammosilenae]NYI08171.1 ABC-type transport system substrate-binding protein [Allostreptomyces psammosilenae]